MTPTPPAPADEHRASLCVVRLERSEAQAVSDLILACFWRFNADQYGEHTSRFTDSVTAEKIEQFIAHDLMLGAKDHSGALCGVIGLVEGGSHLELLFVREESHKRGIATLLWNAALAALGEVGPREITVHSSDHALKFYEKLGFVRVPHERPIVKRLAFRRAKS